MPPASTDSREQLALALVGLAREAAAVVMEVYGSDFGVASKADASPVTLADHRAEEVILDGLARLEPGVGVVAEEAFAAGSTEVTGDSFFLVDPLDGTREFVGRNGEFTVNIALVENAAPVMGVIAAPAQNRLFAAWGHGLAHEIGADGAMRRIAARAPPPTGFVAVASRSHRDAATDAYLAALDAHDTRAAGSSLKFCLIAAGEADVYPRFGPTCEWDTAAGHAILAAAGGGMVELDGRPFVYGKRDRRYLNPGFLAWGDGPRPPLPDPALIGATG